MFSKLECSNYFAYDYFSQYPVIPVYLNLSHVSSLMREWRLLIRLFKSGKQTSSNIYANELLSEIKRIGASIESGVVPRSLEDLIELLSKSLLSNRGAESQVLPGLQTSEVSRTLLPVERFFVNGNFGSGRHVRVNNFEIKGVGRNCCATRNDWNHSWGGLDVFPAIREHFISAQVESIAPLGAVPVSSINVLAPTGSPLLMKDHSSQGVDSELFLLGQLIRPCEYTRLANIYFGLDSDNSYLKQEEFCAISDIISHYACLTAYGYFHTMPTDDNLTLNGTLIDVASLFLKTHDVQVKLFRKLTTSEQCHRFTPKKVIQVFAEESTPTPMKYCCSAAAHLYAIERIAKVREKLWQEALSVDWKQMYLKQIAFYFLIKNGLSAKLAEQYRDQIYELFQYLLVDYNLTPQEYLKANPFKVTRLSDKQALSILMEHSKELAELNKLRSSFQPYSELIKRYNSRLIDSKRYNILSKDFQSLRGFQLFLRISNEIKRYEIFNRRYCPLARANQTQAIHTILETSQIRLSGSFLTTLFLLFAQPKSIKVVVSFLSANNKLRRKRIAAKIENDDLVVKIRNLPREGIIEGVDLVVNNESLSYPLTLSHYIRT